MSIAVIGATGFTGRLVVEHLVERGLPVVCVGRSPDKLATLPPSAERRVADASDVASLQSAMRGCDVAVSCVGPFVDLGEPVVRAAIAAGVHYIDVTGEQAFMRRVFEDLHPAATDAGVALVPAVGIDYVPGDMAAGIAARRLGEPAHTVEVYTLITGARSSSGTRRTGRRVRELTCLVWEDGRPAVRDLESEHRTFEFPEPYGTHTVSLWPGGEALSVPRHTPARNVACFLRVPPPRRQPDEHRPDPDPGQRRQGRFVVVAEARSASAAARCIVEGHDMYGMTAAACAEAASRLIAPGFTATGALATAQAFDAESFLRSLGAYLDFRVSS